MRMSDKGSGQMKHPDFDETLYPVLLSTVIIIIIFFFHFILQFFSPIFFFLSAWYLICAHFKKKICNCQD